MKAEAVDLIEKPCGDEALIGAIESAMKRDARTDRSARIPEAAARIAELSPREREVLDALALGHSDKVIAYHLGISPRTVDVHRARMVDRLAVRQFAEAIRLAALAGLAGGECGGAPPELPISKSVVGQKRRFDGQLVTSDLPR